MTCQSNFNYFNYFNFLNSKRPLEIRKQLPKTTKRGKLKFALADHSKGRRAVQMAEEREAASTL